MSDDIGRQLRRLKEEAYYTIENSRDHADKAATTNESVPGEPLRIVDRSTAMIFLDGVWEAFWRFGRF